MSPHQSKGDIPQRKRNTQLLESSVSHQSKVTFPSVKGIPVTREGCVTHLERSKPMSYKLLAVDIDGTLLDSNGNLTAETIKAVNEGIEKGMIFTYPQEDPCKE